MAHVSLYRKWRPRAFAQIVGQEPIVRTLKRAIETDRVAHAYLFSGPRGTGKTSTAKVLAMGINCEQGPTSEPCGVCASCRSIVNNSSIDVLEMDAASNRGIDEIRELRDRVNLAPSQGRKKVYIIDEVHMLTTEAFNALLKMLEEPPEHVVFILATTEKHRVLPTIISRCQSFDFRRPGVDTLVEKLAEISGVEEIPVEPEALAVIARSGNGSFRDAEGLLDQLAAFAEGTVTAGQVRELLGSVGPEVLLETVDALNERRAGDALRIVDRLAREGRDPGQFVQELVAHLKRLMLLPHAPELALAEVGSGEREALEGQVERVPAAEVVRTIEALGETLGRVKRGGSPRLELELTLLKLAREYTEPSVEHLISRLERLEQAAANGGLSAHPPPTMSPEAPTLESAGESPEDEPTPTLEAEAATPNPAPGELAPEEPVLRNSAPAAGSEGLDGERLVAEWRGILDALRRRRQVPTAAVFQEGSVTGFRDGVLVVSFPKEQDFYVRLAESARHSDALKAVLEERFGEKVHVRCVVADGSGGGGNESAGGGEEVPAARPVPDPVPVDEPDSGWVQGEGVQERGSPEEPELPDGPAGGSGSGVEAVSGGSGGGPPEPVPPVEEPPVRGSSATRVEAVGRNGDDIIQSPREAADMLRGAFREHP